MANDITFEWAWINKHHLRLETIHEDKTSESESLVWTDGNWQWQVGLDAVQIVAPCPTVAALCGCDAQNSKTQQHVFSMFQISKLPANL